VARRGESLDLEAIMARVQAVLARFKHPRRLVVVEELPRNTMGKVQKNLLRAQIGG
jgi:malonyl-CoA/methylmalonyl-CoA synthetase